MASLVAGAISLISVPTTSLSKTSSLTESPAFVTLAAAGNTASNAALVPVADLTTTTILCGLGCAINAKYESTQLSSFIEFSAYSITSGIQSVVGVGQIPTGGCTTTTIPPVTTTARTIKMNATLSGTDLDNFAATQIEHLLGYSDCFANAVLVTPEPVSDSPSSTTASSPSSTLLPSATILAVTPSPSSSRLKRPAVIALSTLIPIAIGLLLLAGVLFYRRRRLKLAQASTQFIPVMKDGSSKPELHAEQSRHEMPARASRFEMGGETDDDDRRTSTTKSKIQELGGVEPSGELSTSRFSKTSLR